ncbi:hypothetical protein HCH15_07515 [Corynebacterium testudinoris]|uniref:YPDG domain-containing protein n=1 Tax=Corynebacterium testudinoris TaxID=136857 RepID=UPI001C8B7B93|nr:YPDG domain-containing protein [Corynebacterium testudinoris]MBX8996032.1 hypothetical protein [Corynebacterium testudinoris]
MSSVLTPVAQAQDVRPEVEHRDGDRTVACSVDWNAEAIYDPRFGPGDWTNMGFSENVYDSDSFKKLLQVQHWGNNARVAVATSKQINNAKLVINLQEVEGQTWRGTNSVGRLWGRPAEPLFNKPIDPTGTIAGNVVTYDLGTLDPGSFFSTGQSMSPGFSLAQLMEFTKPAADGTWSNAFMVNAQLTGDLAPGSTEDCAATFDYEDATTKAGEPVDPAKVDGFNVPAGSDYTVDEDALPTGWKASVDDATGTLTVTPPADAKRGDSADVTVTVKIPNGITQTATAKVTVVSDAPYVFGYDDAETRAGEPVNPVKTGDFDFPNGTTFETNEDALPDGWKASVDENGTLTVTPPADAKRGDSAEVTVTATLPDGSTQTTTVTVKVVSDAPYVFGYDDAETRAGEPVNPVKTGDFDFPNGTTFETNEDALPDGWKASVDENGTLTVTPPADAKRGDSAEVTVTATLPDGSTQTTTVTVKVVSDAPYTFGYNDAETKAGEPVNPAKTGDFDFPNGTTYETNEDALPDGWKASVDENGTLTVTPPADAKRGDSAEVTVTATLPDGSTQTTTVTVTVTGEDADVVFGYTDATTKPGVPVDPSKVPGFDLPEGTTYVVDEDALPTDWDAKVDTDGNLTVTPPATAKDGDSAKIKVTATLPDGTVKETSVTVTVKDDDGAVVPGAGTCVAAGLTVGLPLLLLVPVGMAGQLNIPGLDQLNADLQAQLRNANSQLQQQFGIFDPAQAQYINQINSEIARFTADNRTIINGAAMVALGLLAAAYLYNSCVGEDGTSSTSSLSSGSSE